MQFEVLHANFDYSNLSLIKVKHKDSANFDHYHLIDHVAQIDYDLEGTIVEIKEIDSESEFKWKKKAAAVAVGCLVAGPFGAVAGGVFFGNGKKMICTVTLSTGYKVQARIDEDAFEFLKRCAQYNCSKIAKQMTENFPSSNIVSAQIEEAPEQTPQDFIKGKLFPPLTDYRYQQTPQDSIRDRWLKKVKKHSGGDE